MSSILDQITPELKNIFDKNPSIKFDNEFMMDDEPIDATEKTPSPDTKDASVEIKTEAVDIAAAENISAKIHEFDLSKIKFETYESPRLNELSNRILRDSVYDVMFNRSDATTEVNEDQLLSRWNDLFKGYSLAGQDPRHIVELQSASMDLLSQPDIVKKDKVREALINSMFNNINAVINANRFEPASENSGSILNENRTDLVQSLNEAESQLSVKAREVAIIENITNDQRDQLLRAFQDSVKFHKDRLESYDTEVRTMQQLATGTMDPETASARMIAFDKKHSNALNYNPLPLIDRLVSNGDYKSAISIADRNPSIDLDTLQKNIIKSGDLENVFNFAKDHYQFNAHDVSEFISRIKPSTLNEVDLAYYDKLKRLVHEKLHSDVHSTSNPININTPIDSAVPIKSTIPTLNEFASSNAAKESVVISPEGYDPRNKGISNNPYKATIIPITEQNPVKIGDTKDGPVLATSGFACIEKGKVKYLSQEELEKRKKQAEDELENKGTQRSGNILSHLLYSVSSLTKDLFNRNNQRNELSVNAKSLEDWRNQQAETHAYDAKAHADMATKYYRSIEADAEIAELIKKRDAIKLKADDVFSIYQYNKINEEINRKIDRKPELKEAKEHAAISVRQAMACQMEFSEYAKKAGMRPDAMLELNRLDDSSLNQLKEMMKKIGLNKESNEMVNIDKMKEMISQTVANLVERFQTMFKMGK